MYRKKPWIAATWLCFVLPLLPVLAFFQNGDQAFASRFTYLPSLAPSIAAAFIAAVAYKKLITAKAGYRYGIVTACMGIILFHAGMTVWLIGVWKNSETAWSRVIGSQPLAIIFKERGKYYYSIGNYMAAVSDYSAAMERAPASLTPYLYNLYAFRGEAHRAAGRYGEAVRDFTTAISMHRQPVYFYCRGLALKELGREREAESDLSIAGEEKGPLDWYWESSK